MDAGNGDMKLLHPEGMKTMKIRVLTAVILASALAGPIVSAQEKSTTTKPAMTMPMDMDKQMPQMQANMEKMQQQMDKFQATTDPKERQKLMQEHMSAMQETMKTMHGMGGSMMTGSGEHRGMTMAGKKSAMTEADMMQCHEMMVARTDMMQMMMEQMMQHDQAMASMSVREQ